MTGPPGWDPGLAALRTTLSWQRSVILLAVVATVLAREAIVHGRPLLGLLVGGALLVATVGLYAWRGRLGPEQAQDEQARRHALLALTVAAVLAGICALVIVVATPA